MHRPTGAQDERTTDLVPRFLASLGDLHVEGHLVKSSAETTDVLRGLLSKAGCRSVVVAGIPERYAAAVMDALQGVNVDLLEELQGKPQGEVIGKLAGSDAGVTWATNGLAMEGALLEVAFDDSYKLASSLPILHVALLESSSILRDLAEALPLVGRLIARSPAGKKPTISFISGASKTGDIEMRLLYGVHGPHTVHAVILDWS